MESVLYLQRLLADQISEVGSRLDPLGDDILNVADQWRVIVNRVCEANHTYPTGVTYEDRFWRLMMADIQYELQSKEEYCSELLQ